MRLQTIACLALLTAAGFAPDALADGRQAGSALIYPIQRSGMGRFTIVSVTNTNTTPMTPVGQGGSTNLHFEYYNVVENTQLSYSGVPITSFPFNPTDCIIFDRVEFLTPADTLSVLTSCHNATANPGQDGFLTIIAQDPSQFDTDWCHNHLIGSEIVINASGSMYSLNAYPLNGRDVGGQCVLEPLPNTLMIDSFIAMGTPHLTLVSESPQPQDLRHLMLTVFNDNEFPLSATLAFNCWFDQPLNLVSPLFDESFLRSTVNDPSELDVNCDGVGDLETGWVQITTRSLTTPGGTQVQGRFGMIGAITAGPLSNIDGGRLLWNSRLP